jgi:hypothetical protein
MRVRSGRVAAIAVLVSTSAAAADERAAEGGERYHPLMTPVAETLSDQDIDELAAYDSEIRPQDEAR